MRGVEPGQRWVERLDQLYDWDVAAVGAGLVRLVGVQKGRGNPMWPEPGMLAIELDEVVLERYWERVV